MSYAEKLEELITKSVIPDIDERLDEIFTEIADSKDGDIEEDECKELIDDILEAQKESDEDDFGFEEEEEI